MLLLMLTPLVVAAIIVRSREAGWRWWLALRVRRRWLIWLAAGVHLLRITNPGWAAWFLIPTGGLWPVLATWCLGVAFCMANVRGASRRARIGLASLLAGLSLNSLTIALNDGMPFSVGAAHMAGAVWSDMSAASPGHRPASPGTRLVAFADIIPVPGLQKVISVGDLLVFFGVAWLVVTATPTRPRHPADHGRFKIE
jgi:hypothetical protein